MEPSENYDEDTEFSAMRQVYSALKDLDIGAQKRVLDYICGRLALKREALETELSTRTVSAAPSTESTPSVMQDSDSNAVASGDEELEGISPIAQKWMRRNGLTSTQLSALFSLGIDDIDLVAKSVPGKSKAERVRSVLLLQGIAGYLSSGAARVTDEKLREACGHYDAYDVTNFTKHLKAIASEVSGARQSGYTLTSRGISAATELIKEMTSPRS